MTATVTPANATNKKVTWSSDKQDIARVDANGTVTAHKAGEAVIAVTTHIKAGLECGFTEGEVRGKSLGLVEGARQKALETARLMKQANCEIPFIEKMSGLSKAEVEAIK